MPDCAAIIAQYVLKKIKAVKEGNVGSWNLEDLSFKDLGEDIHEGNFAVLMRLRVFVNKGESANLLCVDDAVQPGGSFNHIADTTKRPTVYNQPLPPFWSFLDIVVVLLDYLYKAKRAVLSTETRSGHNCATICSASITARHCGTSCKGGHRAAFVRSSSKPPASSKTTLRRPGATTCHRSGLATTRCARGKRRREVKAPRRPRRGSARSRGYRRAAVGGIAVVRGGGGG